MDVDFEIQNLFEETARRLVARFVLAGFVGFGFFLVAVGFIFGFRVRLIRLLRSHLNLRFRILRIGRANQTNVCIPFRGWRTLDVFDGLRLRGSFLRP